MSVWSWDESPRPGVKSKVLPEAFSIPRFPPRIIISATDTPDSEEIVS